MESRYKSIDLPFDNVNSFDGNKEYDHSSYLCDMLIVAHTVDPVFQKDCNKLFSFDTFGIKCKYSPAPVKTKERCITKAELGT